MPALDGLLIVNKPIGPTSHDIVAVARRAIGTPKVGHTGTLDPAASGVLPLVLGRATRLARFLASDEKAYVASVRFGRTTDTYDAAGEVTSETGMVPERAALERALEGLVGTFDQTPPAYSAKKIDGVRAYALARRQAAVTPTPVAVTVHGLALVRFEPPIAELAVACSAGFYVRSLAHDLGQCLGTGAILDALIRVSAGRFTLAHSVPFERLTPENRDDLVTRIVPMEAALTHLPTVHLTEAGVRRVRHGQDVGPEDVLPPSSVSSVSSVSSAAVTSLSSARAASSGGTAPVALLGPDRRLVAIGGPAAVPGFLHASVVVG